LPTLEERINLERIEPIPLARKIEGTLREVRPKEKGSHGATKLRKCGGTLEPATL